MDHTPNRLSTYSNSSTPIGPRSAGQQATQVSTTTLLNTLHTIYTSAQPYPLDASTSLVVNTWLTALEPGNESRAGGTVDGNLARRAWEHARRRAEDGCIVLGSLHQSTPSLIVPFISALPLSIPQTLYTALSVLRPLTCSVTPFNASSGRHSALAATFTLTHATGNLTAASLALSTSGIDSSKGLLNISAEAGYRAFDVFYYLLTSASTPAEREFLSLKNPSAYALLNKSGTYEPPSYLPTADDTASAEDFRQSLKAIGIRGSAQRDLLSVLAGLLKLGETLGFLIDAEELEEVCDEVGGLLSLDPDVLNQKCSTNEREVVIAGIYECLVDWVIMKANTAITADIQRSRQDGAESESGSGEGGTRTPQTSEDVGDTVSITIVEIPGQELGKAVSLRGVFDDNEGINHEMKEDGIEIIGAGSSVIKEMHNAVADVAADLGIPGGPVSREREYELDRREGVLEKVGVEVEVDSFLRKILYPVEGEGVNVGKHGRFDLPALLGSSRVWYHLSLHPTDDSPGKLASLASTTSAWSAGTVSRQLRAWRLPEWANRRNKNLDFTADFEIAEFATRYSRLGCKEGRDGVESWIMERGWSNGDAVVGHDRVWIRESAWWEAESMLDMKPEFDNSYEHPTFGLGSIGGHEALETGYSATTPGMNGSGFFPPMGEESTPHGSRDNLLSRAQSSAAMSRMGVGAPHSIAPTKARTLNTMPGDYGLGAKGDDTKDRITYYDGEYDGVLDPEMGEPKHIVSQSIPWSRRVWVAFVWALTFWIPSFVLRYVGRMKRPDVRMAWREKLVLVLLIFLLNGIVVFYIIEFGRILCPNFDKVWNEQEVGFHQGDTDFWVSIHGRVYDISKFWQTQHSDTPQKTTKQNMQPFGGMNLDAYFPPPLIRGCPELVKNDFVQLTANISAIDTSAVHTVGHFQPNPQSKLANVDWYKTTFQLTIEQYFKGDLAWNQGNVTAQGQEQGRQWVILRGKIYDLTDYFHTLDINNNLDMYAFFPTEVSNLIKNNAGQDVTAQWQNTANFTNSLRCMNNVFYKGITDFRDTPKCQVNNYILLAFTIVLCTVILTKFLAALQFGSKRRPAAQDKFVICQVPAYTEGEDQLRKGLDSLTALQYDNKRKLICVICDGMIVGGGNDRPTPKIVLDILGVDPKIDPPALPFKSVGQGNEQLNYGKVYSGLYEYEGNVVPYIVVVKVGKESEQTKSKPGNRGKRDSQILLLSFLNRVHHRAPMSPLELEMFHQINNIIGVDPELYEYLFMVDADTQVREDSLNRLVASCANDAKIAGICGETSLENEERSWWTMIQVYEYYISHHLAKAFESLFGSVTCLPGCFCMYRLRTTDKGRPLIISEKVISEYSDCNVDTLHKKNLLALGEDRYLTTLMTKHFPAMSYKFIPDAYAATAAPETWGVLVSQRRRWINSTIHNLAELVFLKDLCGFCCFSMRFVVFIDLFGTIILPATCAYLGYLIYRVATHSGQFPLISIIMIAAVYGLQALIFILRRQWQHVGWMIIYILAFPIYSFVLPIFSFWQQDDFSWGNTRIVLEEKGNKQIVALEDEGFDPRSIPLQRWDDYAAANSLPGRRGLPGSTEKVYMENYNDNGYEMDDIHSTYSSVKPASTVLTGFPHAAPAYMPPQSPAPFTNMHRQSTYSNFAPYTDQPQYQPSRVQSMVGIQDQYHETASNPRLSRSNLLSSDNLMGMHSPPLGNNRSTLGYSASRPMSTVDFRGVSSGPDDATIIEAIQACLVDADLETVTKKQVRALVEQRLQMEMNGERKAFLDNQIDVELASMIFDQHLRYGSGRLGQKKKKLKVMEKRLKMEVVQSPVVLLVQVLEEMYTTSFAFFEALWEAGITHCFVNLGSDHPSIIEAMVKGQNEKKDQFPRIITCPNEMVALSMADGYARLTSEPQCVIVHVDVGTQGLGAAVHNASCGRAPVLIFAGLSPYTIEGELRGSRTEYIHWIQDVPDQKQIVSQYCRYTGEIKTGRNVKQMVRRALQFATSGPAGPVYLYGAREAMEEELQPYTLDPSHWSALSPCALPASAVHALAAALVHATAPLLIVGYSGRNHAAVHELVTLADTIPGLRVLDTGGCDLCFPYEHRASLGLRYGIHDAIPAADVILVADCDVPWIPTQCRPSEGARIFHVDVDPLKQQMPVFYIPAVARWKADAATVFRQLWECVLGDGEMAGVVKGYGERGERLARENEKRLDGLRGLARPESDGTFGVSYLSAAVRQAVPRDTIFAVEAVTNAVTVADQIRAELPGTWINCGGGGLGWSGGGALGIKLAAEKQGKGSFVCQIVGDGTFLFSVPGSVYWISQRYGIPILTIVLNNEGWNAPRKSLLLVHPDGLGSKVSNTELNISFKPTPDYAGIAKAASGGEIWAGRAGTVDELKMQLAEAVEAVKGGRSAVLDAHLGGSVGKYTGK